MGSEVHSQIPGETCEGAVGRACSDEEEEKGMGEEGRWGKIPIEGGQGVCRVGVSEGVG